MKDPLFSIITCSVNPEKTVLITNQVRSVFPEDTQLVLINDAKSLAEGYQRGLEQSKGQILVFCHDDIAFLEPKTPEFIVEDLDQFDLVGVAGTSRLVTGNWAGGGYPFLHGQIIHHNPDHSTYTHFIYGCGEDPWLKPDIQALDGVLMAGRRTIFKTIGFDRTRFNGFHLYDLDFSYSAFLAGHRLVVDHRIRLLHNSGGHYDKTWKKFGLRFNRKYKDHLKLNFKPCYYYLGFSFESEMEAIQSSKNALRLNRLKFENGQIFQSKVNEPWMEIGHLDHSKQAADYLILMEPLDPESFLPLCKPRCQIRVRANQDLMKLVPTLTKEGFKVVASSNDLLFLKREPSHFGP